MRRKRAIQTPPIPLMEAELRRVRKRSRFATRLLKSSYTLVVVAAMSVLVATLLTPVLLIHGGSMTPTLEEGQYVVSIKGTPFQQGDLVSFYNGNSLLVKRVIALPGDWVDIKEDGTVFVNGVELDEPYVSEKSFGDCDLELPYQVPESRYFLMGDHRETSRDSRSSTIGCVDKDRIVGKIVLCVWPLKDFAIIE